MHHLKGNNGRARTPSRATAMQESTMIRYALIAAAGLMLVACGASDDAPLPAEPADAPTTPAAAQLTLTVADHIASVGGRVRALAALPQTPAYRSRVLAAFDGPDAENLAVLDLATGTQQILAVPPARSLITAPDFQLRGIAAPLILAAGEASDPVSVYLFLEEDGGLEAVLATDENPAPTITLAPVPTDPIAPDLDVQRICPVRASDAAVEFIVVDRDYAEVWRIRDTGAEALAAERLREAPDAVGARDCAERDGGGALVLDRTGRFANSPTPWKAVAAAPAADQLSAEIALAVRQDGRGVAALDMITGARLADVTLAGGLNTPDIPDPDVLAVSAGNFGGSYAAGVIVAAEGEAVSIIGLDSLTQALAALD